MSSVETGQMSAVETGQMPAAETEQMSAVETRQMYSIETGQSPVSIVDIYLVSTADISTSFHHSESAFSMKNQHICHRAFRHQGPSYNAFTIPDSLYQGLRLMFSLY